MGSNVYLKKDGPRFFAGHSVILVYIVAFVFGGSLLTTVLLRLENKKRLVGKRNIWIEGKTPEEIQSLGDKMFVFPMKLSRYTDVTRPSFLYIV